MSSYVSMQNLGLQVLPRRAPADGFPVAEYFGAKQHLLKTTLLIRLI